MLLIINLLEVKVELIIEANEDSLLVKLEELMNSSEDMVIKNK